jgi:hypothetical protein
MPSPGRIAAIRTGRAEERDGARRMPGFHLHPLQAIEVERILRFRIDQP